MKKIFALLALAILPLTAVAHGPSPQKVDQSVTIKAEPEKVWAMVKDFGNMHKWHPNVASTKVEKKGNDTFRTLTFKSGGTSNEKLRDADDQAQKMRYEIVEGSLPVADYNSFITVKPGPNAGETTVQWVARFYRVYKLNPPIPAGQDDESALKAATELVETGLQGLKKTLEGK